jgi:predicted PurR-regulated permease PerM
MAEADSSRVMAGGTSMPRGLVVILASTGLLVTTLALQQFASVISPVLLALVLVVGVHPLTGLLRRRGAPEWLAITCTLLVLVAIIVGLAVAFALSLAQLGTVLPAYQDRFTAFLDDLEAWLATLGIGRDQLKAALGQISFGRIAGFFTDLLVGLAGAFSNLLLLLLIVLFMGLDSTYFARRLTQVGDKQKAIAGALGGFAHGTRTYLVVSTIFGLIVAAIDTGFLWIVGVPLAVLWGLLAFVTNYIPNVGFLIGLVPARAAGPARGRPGTDDQCDRRLQRDQLRDPVGDPAQVRQRLREPLADLDLPVPPLLVLRDRPARCGPGHTAHPPRQGAAARRGPGHPLDLRTVRERRRGPGSARPAGSLPAHDAPEVPGAPLPASDTPAADGQATGPGAGEPR